MTDCVTKVTCGLSTKPSCTDAIIKWIWDWKPICPFYLNLSMVRSFRREEHDWSERSHSNHSTNVGQMVCQRSRRWSCIKATASKLFVACAERQVDYGLTHNQSSPSIMPTMGGGYWISQQTRGNKPMLFQCCPTAFDAVPTLKQH